MRTFVGLCRLHVDYETVENTTKTQNTLSKVIVLVGLATVRAAAAEPSMREQVTVEHESNR
jgi:hypothetical protein